MQNDYVVTELEELRSVIGEENLSALLSSYRCPLNPVVEDFLRSKAVQSSRLGTSVTYLVSDSGGTLLGYFTLLLKAFRASRPRACPPRTAA